MKPSAILINTSRGGVVVEEDLLVALNSEKISFTCLDVLQIEPPKKDNPLLNHARAFVTPHFAWNTEEAIDRLTNSVVENLEAYSQNQSLGRHCQVAGLRFCHRLSRIRFIQHRVRPLDRFLGRFLGGTLDRIVNHPIDRLSAVLLFLLLRGPAGFSAKAPLELRMVRKLLLMYRGPH